MASLVTRLMVNNKTQTVSSNVLGPIGAFFVGIYTEGLTVDNSVSISSRINQLFNALRDGNYISWVAELNPIYATMDINGGAMAFETTYIAMTPGQVRVGIGPDVRFKGSMILENAIKETYDYANENDALINGG